MGFFVAGISNLFTKYRYNRDKKVNAMSQQFLMDKTVYKHIRHSFVNKNKYDCGIIVTVKKTEFNI